MTGSVCSFFIFCFILLLHLYPRKGTEFNDGLIASANFCSCTFTPARGRNLTAPLINNVQPLHLYPRKGTETVTLIMVKNLLMMLHLYPRKGTETTVLWPLFIGDHPCCTFTPARGRKLRKCSSRVRPQRCTFTPARGRKR